ncbi:hypothetical protein DER45DRAFT_552768 [Fusarium avenaceum]|nr:hypothetical protein DER45DRAFT_552768 [Fusarium avenaceum]
MAKIERGFQILPEFPFEEEYFQHFRIPPDWQGWETAWLFRLSAIVNNPRVPARMIQSGCTSEHGDVNCTQACGDAAIMFGNAETLWNCLTLATVAMMTTGTNAPHKLNRESVKNVTAMFNIGPLSDFTRMFIFGKYVRCALQSCSDSRFGACPPELWDFEYKLVNMDNIKRLGHTMATSYCAVADPGIDYDIAGPGIIVAYLIQFTIVFFFALAFKITKTWVRNFTLASLLPFHGPVKSLEKATLWQKRVSRSSFGVAVGSTIVDLQEGQAVFLTIFSAVAIVTFCGSNSTGLGNISSLFSWLANNLALRGVVSAGMYPLLLLQLILHKSNNRWWYTLFLVVGNWILVLVIVQPQTIDDSLTEHIQETASLNGCGGRAGPRTYCQTFNKPTNLPGGSTIANDAELFHLTRDIGRFFNYHSKSQAPIHVIIAFLLLDWMSMVMRMWWFENDTWLSRRGRIWVHQMPTPIRQFFIQRYFLLLVEILWVSMEVLAVVMAIIGIHEFMTFIDILIGGSYGEESAIWISKWGFGQLVAVCVWFPFILKFISLNIDGALPGLRRRLGEYIDISYRNEEEDGRDDVSLETLLPNRHGGDS